MNIAKRIFGNTLILYFKVIFTTVIALYLTRVVLNVLGVEDFGLYSLIAGVVSFMSFLNTALMSSTQRFLSVAIGEGNIVKMKKIFSSSIAMHLVLSIIIVIVLEVIGIFIFDGFLNIPEGRETSAKIIYHIMVATTFFTVMSAPYNAAINSYEDMYFFAIVEIFASVLKLCVVWLFTHINFDHLILYTGWISLITIVCFVIKILWCHVKYSEIKYEKRDLLNSKETITEMMGFIGWNTFGSFAVILRNQGVAIVLNTFFSTAINAVYGIANQVSSQLSYFSQMMTTSMTPQIMKSKGENNENRLLYLSFLTSKLSYFLSIIFAIPLIVNIDFVLKIWLGNVPEFTKYYCITSVIIFLIMQLYPGLNRAIQADGRIKAYNIWLSIIMFIPIIVAVILFYFDVSHKSIMILMILAQVAVMLMTVQQCKKLIHLDIREYYYFIIKAILVFIGITLICIVVKNALVASTEWMVLLLTIVISTILVCVAFYCLILSGKDKAQFKNLITKYLKHD